MKMYWKKVWAAVLVLTMLLAQMQVDLTSQAAGKARLNKKKVTIQVGGKVRLKLKGARGKVVWKSKNKKIATVNARGVVTGKKAGKTVVTAKNKKKTYKCTVTVKAGAPTVEPVPTGAVTNAPGQSTNPSAAPTQSAKPTTAPTGTPSQTAEPGMTTQPAQPTPDDTSDTPETTSPVVTEPVQSAMPTEKPTAKPTSEPTQSTKPTTVPTVKPTVKLTTAPTEKPTPVSTATSTAKPTTAPTEKPTSVSTATPTVKPTTAPTEEPTVAPTTALPTIVPTEKPTPVSTPTPTVKPTTIPTAAPSPTPAPVYQSVTITKVDNITRSQVTGAVLAVYDGSTYIDGWTTAAGQDHIVSSLTPDKIYRLTEVTAPGGYQKASDVYFKVNEQGQAYAGSSEDSLAATGSSTVTMMDVKEITTGEVAVHVQVDGVTGDNYKYSIGLNSSIAGMNSLGLSQFTASGNTYTYTANEVEKGTYTLSLYNWYSQNGYTSQAEIQIGDGQKQTLAYQSNVSVTVEAEKTTEIYITITYTAVATPTPSPTVNPTTAPPTSTPTAVPTEKPTVAPTTVPTEKPTAAPTTAAPTAAPTEKPTVAPTTAAPTSTPTAVPTEKPTVAPTTAAPTSTPTAVPTEKPTTAPTPSPTPALQSVTIAKVDNITRSQVTGAVLAVYDGSTYIDGWTTAAGQDHTVSSLTPDKIYRLTEVTAPGGYQKASDVYFKVNEQGQAYAGSSEDSLAATGSSTVTMMDVKEITTGEVAVHVQVDGVTGDNYKYSIGLNSSIAGMNSLGLSQFTANGNTYTYTANEVEKGTYMLSLYNWYSQNGYTSQAEIQIGDGQKQTLAYQSNVSVTVEAEKTTEIYITITYTAVATPTPSPTVNPTTAPPTSTPTEKPTVAPTTAAPTEKPTVAPTTAAPTAEPTVEPTIAPTTAPPTAKPTEKPTVAPTTAPPTAKPTEKPTAAPTTAAPTSTPTEKPTPTAVPTPTKTPLQTVTMGIRDENGNHVKGANLYLTENLDDIYDEDVVLDRWISAGDSDHVYEELTAGKTYCMVLSAVPTGYDFDDVSDYYFKVTADGKLYVGEDETSLSYQADGKVLTHVTSNGESPDTIYSKQEIPGAGDDDTLTVGAMTVTLGEDTDTVTERLGQPVRIDTNQLGVTVYIYNPSPDADSDADYTNYLAVGFLNDEVVQMFTVSRYFSYEDIVDGNSTSAALLAGDWNKASSSYYPVNAYDDESSAKGKSGACTYSGDQETVVALTDCWGSGQVYGLLVYDGSFTQKQMCEVKYGSYGNNVLTSFRNEIYDMSTAFRVMNGVVNGRPILVSDAKGNQIANSFCYDVLEGEVDADLNAASAYFRGKDNTPTMIVGNPAEGSADAFAAIQYWVSYDFCRNAMLSGNRWSDPTLKCPFSKTGVGAYYSEDEGKLVMVQYYYY